MTATMMNSTVERPRTAIPIATKTQSIVSIGAFVAWPLVAAMCAWFIRDCTIGYVNSAGKPSSSVSR